MLQGFTRAVYGCLASSLCRSGLVSVGKVWHCFTCLPKLPVARKHHPEKKGFAFCCFEGSWTDGHSLLIW